MEIVKLHIKNYRSIKDSQEIELTKLFGLIGRNNTGKSAILKAVQVLWGKLDIKPTDFHKNEEALEIFAILQDEDYKSDENLEGKIKICLKCSKGSKKKYFLNDEGTEEEVIKKKLPDLLIINDIRDPGDSTTSGVKSTILNKILKKAKSPKVSEDLINQIEEKKTEDAKQVSELITNKFQDIVDVKDYTVNINPDIDIEKGIKYHTTLINASLPDCNAIDILNCGTGLQSMYILAMLETLAEMEGKSDKAILLIEEPEVYLHPDFQRRMFKALRKIAENNQVIFSTHSPIMISELWTTKSIRQISLNERGETVINLIKIEEVIDELGIQYEDILNPSLILFVEGENDKKFFEKIGLNSHLIKIINSDGLRALHYFAYIKILTIDHVSNDFRIIVDSDGLDPRKRLEEVKKDITEGRETPININLDEKIIVLSEYSPESYFLKADVLSKAFPKIKKEDIERLISIYKKEFVDQKGKLKIEDFQKYFNPKKIFEKTIKNKQDYIDFWKNKEDFLSIRDQILFGREEIEKQGKHFFEHILGTIDLEKDLPKELITKKDDILKLLKNN